MAGFLHQTHFVDGIYPETFGKMTRQQFTGKCWAIGTDFSRVLNRIPHAWQVISRIGVTGVHYSLVFQSNGSGR